MIYIFGLNSAFANSAPSNEIANFPDYNRGLGIAFEQTEGKPEMKGLNGLFQLITVSMLSLKQRGISLWDQSLEYPKSSFAVESDILYQAKVASTNKRPSISQNEWRIWASVSDITVGTNGNLKKTNNSNGSIGLEVLTATTSERGAMRFATPTEVANSLNVAAAITPSDVGNTFSQDSSDNGWCKMPNGLIFQWGVGNGVNNTQVNFNIPFPNQCFTVSVSDRDGLVAHGYTLPTKAKFNLRAASAISFSWFAIGK